MNQDLITEWKILHNNHEEYEKYALIIKLLTIAIALTCFLFSISNIIAICILSILWLQEGIWKTYQSRISNRIEKIELSQRLDPEELEQDKLEPFQFYSQWNESRQSSLGLIMEYIKSTLKPTVLYPYLPLIIIMLFT